MCDDALAGAVPVPANLVPARPERDAGAYVHPVANLNSPVAVNGGVAAEPYVVA